jgi:hypothetical protein
MRRIAMASLLLLAAMVASIVLVPGATQAKAKPVVKRTVPLEKAIWGPERLNDGSDAFPIYHELGVGVYQVQLDWATTAPTQPEVARDPSDPAYVWPAALDAAVASAGAQGIQVAIMVRSTPAWANGGQTPDWRPTNAADYADFMVAAARHYPSVRRWMVWGEPTRQGSFSPMPQNSPVGPRAYAQLVDATYAALKPLNPANIIIGGMTFTAGLVLPGDFVKWMRLPNGKPPRLDWYGHNAFSTRFPRIKDSVYFKGVRDINDLDTLHDELRVAYKGRRTPKIWVSEFTISSDHANRAFTFSVSQAEQARWLKAAYALVDRLPYVAGMGWFNLQDEVETGDLSALTTGLLTADGTRKPAFGAYQAAK